MNQTPINQPNILIPGSILSVDDYVEGSRGGQWSISPSTDIIRCDRTYQNKLKVITSSKYIGAAQIIQSFGLQLGQTYQFPLVAGSPTENDTGSYLQSINAVNVSEDGVQWLVTLDYAPFDINYQLGSESLNIGLINPLDRILDVFWTEPAKYENYKPYDETPANETGSTEGGGGPKPYVNSIGDPLLNPPKTEETRPRLKIIRNESTYNDDYASQFKDTVNADVFLGYPPNTVKCADIFAQRFYDSDWGFYHRVSYTFEFRDDDDGKGYTLEILNQGYRQLVNGTGSPVNVTDANGQIVTDAVNLQQNGAYTPGANPYYLEFQEFPAIQFAQLNIPDDILFMNS